MGMIYALLKIIKKINKIKPLHNLAEGENKNTLNAKLLNCTSR
jgi:hypothetical protein